MSLYNALFGFNPACVFFMPMLGRKQEEYPRFRDCFISEDKQHIEIYTRVGGNNRGCGYGEEELYKDPNFVNSYDDDFDNTYATYVFKVPEKWKKDYELILAGKMKEVSDEYVNQVKEIFPVMAERGDIDKIFRETEGEQ